MGKYRNYTVDDLILAVENSFTLAEVLKKLDLKIAGGNYDQLRKNIAKHKLDVSHFCGKVWSKGKSIKDWSEYKRDASRKKLLILERGHKCEECGLSEWRDFSIVLELHHINGNRLHNDKENLRLLCCNCHSTTTNWRNKKREHIDDDITPEELFDTSGIPDLIYRKEEKDGGIIRVSKNQIIFPKCSSCEDLVKRKGAKFCSYRCSREKSASHIPTREQLVTAFSIYKNFVQVAKHFDVSDNAVRKWVSKYDLWETLSQNKATVGKLVRPN